MNWYGTSGGGSQSGAGTRADDPDSMCGNAILYDAVAGKILTVGGAPAYVSESLLLFCYKDGSFLASISPKLPKSSSSS